MKTDIYIELRRIDRQLDIPWLQLTLCCWRTGCCYAWKECVCVEAVRRVIEVEHAANLRCEWRHAVSWRHSTSTVVGVASGNTSRRTWQPVPWWRRTTAAVPRPRRHLCSTQSDEFHFYLHFQFHFHFRLLDARNVPHQLPRNTFEFVLTFKCINCTRISNLYSRCDRSNTPIKCVTS